MRFTVFVLSALKSSIQNIQFPKNQTHCTYVWLHKDGKHNGRTTLRLAYYGCKNLAHTSKMRQVKRTQMVASCKC